MSGNVIENINNFLSSSEIEEITKKKEITIISSNKKYFQPLEEVKLYVDIKNISTLTIKVFEINTEHYYLKNKKPFDNSISLDGLNPIFN